MKNERNLKHGDLVIFSLGKYDNGDVWVTNDPTRDKLTYPVKKGTAGIFIKKHGLFCGVLLSNKLCWTYDDGLKIINPMQPIL